MSKDYEIIEIAIEKFHSSVMHQRKADIAERDLRLWVAKISDDDMPEYMRRTQTILKGDEDLRAKENII